MKEIIERLSIMLLACFSFYYTDKVINLINKEDPLMDKILSSKDEYTILPVNSILEDDTIIPGINGREVDINKSYENMKLGGIFREDALVFKDIYPTSTLEDNIDKYIIKGNSTKKEVSLLVIFNDNYIDKIKRVNNINIFMNHKDLNSNNINLLKENEIYTYGNNGTYKREILTSDNSLINRLSNNKSNYCLVQNKDDSTLKICSDSYMYTIMPSTISSYYDLKNTLTSGSIILLNNLNDIDVIIKYINSKGYNIVPLSQLLSE